MSPRGANLLVKCQSISMMPTAQALLMWRRSASSYIFGWVGVSLFIGGASTMRGP